MNDLSKEEAIKGAFFGALVGDALCLGTHYEYDAAKIFTAYGNRPLDKFMSPGEMMGGHTHGIGWGERNYHPGKRAGGTTDYGDYNILVPFMGAGQIRAARLSQPCKQVRLLGLEPRTNGLKVQTNRRVRSRSPHGQSKSSGTASVVRRRISASRVC